MHHELAWLEANTVPVQGETAAVGESWRNVDTALAELGLPPALTRERYQRNVSVTEALHTAISTSAPSGTPTHDSNG